MEKVIVTGGAGFLASHLIPALTADGYDVYALDTMVGAWDGRPLPDVPLERIDVRDKKALVDFFTKVGPVAGVFHTAALPRVQFSIEHPEEAHDTNVNGTLALLQAAKERGVGRVVYCASSAAYGDKDTLPLREDMLPEPKSPYALQKYVGEHYCRIFSEVYGLPTVSLRYFNLYGPGSNPNGAYAQALGKFIEQRRQHTPLTVTGDGEQTRDLVHVRDVARANILALRSPKVGKGEVINIGSGRNISVNEMARLVGGEVVHIEPRIESRHTRADITRAKELLEWEPTTSFDEGVAELKKLAGIV